MASPIPPPQPDSPQPLLVNRSEAVPVNVGKTQRSNIAAHLALLSQRNSPPTTAAAATTTTTTTSDDDTTTQQLQSLLECALRDESSNTRHQRDIARCLALLSQRNSPPTTTAAAQRDIARCLALLSHRNSPPTTTAAAAATTTTTTSDDDTTKQLLQSLLKGALRDESSNTRHQRDIARCHATKPPNDDDNNNNNNNNNNTKLHYRLHVGVCSVKASKGEDRHAWYEPSDDTGWSAAVVCDGHNGTGCASFAARMLGPAFERALECRREDNPEWWRSRVPVALRVAFTALHYAWVDMHNAYKEQKKNAPMESNQRGGAAVTMCVFEGGRVFVANVGDSAAVAYTRTAEQRHLSQRETWSTHGSTGFKVHPLTRDHRVDDPMECARLREAGATVARANARVSSGAFSYRPVGPCRVWPGGLAMSRTVGDPECHNAVHSAGPDICVFESPDDGGGLDESTGSMRIVIATDGLWDAEAVFSSADARRGRQFSSDASDSDYSSDDEGDVVRRSSTNIPHPIRRMYSEEDDDAFVSDHGSAFLQMVPGVASTFVPAVKSACLLTRCAMSARGKADDITALVVDMVPERYEDASSSASAAAAAAAPTAVAPLAAALPSPSSSPTRPLQASLLPTIVERATSPERGKKGVSNFFKGLAVKFQSEEKKKVLGIVDVVAESDQTTTQTNDDASRNRFSTILRTASSPKDLMPPVMNVPQMMESKWRRIPVPPPVHRMDLGSVEMVRAHLLDLTSDLLSVDLTLSVRIPESQVPASAGIDSCMDAEDYAGLSPCSSLDNLRSCPSSIDESFDIARRDSPTLGGTFAASLHTKYKARTLARSMRRSFRSMNKRTLGMIRSFSSSHILSSSSSLANARMDDDGGGGVGGDGRRSADFEQECLGTSCNSVSSLASNLSSESSSSNDLENEMLHSLLGGEFDGEYVGLMNRSLHLAT
ncbi:protein serine threonine phosphatase 2c [Pycnococcus provasolii]